MKLHEQIRAAMARAGMNQVQLAEAIGVTKMSVSKWVAGEHNPRIAMLAKIEEALGVKFNATETETEEQLTLLPSSVSPDVLRLAFVIASLPDDKRKTIEDLVSFAASSSVESKAKAFVEAVTSTSKPTPTKLEKKHATRNSGSSSRVTTGAKGRTR